MWKLFIADDEPKIRRGLQKILPWEQMNIEVVGEAEDGVQALGLAKELKPDILFIDINMPFLNGLDLVEQLQHSLERCLTIVITGHDEFTYAQRAVKLRVFDYILKPVTRNNLEQVVAKAVKTLEVARQNEELNKWRELQLKNNLAIIRDAFLVKWVDGLLGAEEVRKNLNFFKLQLEPHFGLMVLKVIQNLDTGASHWAWDRDLLEFAAKNVTEDVLKSEVSEALYAVFNDTRGHIVVLLAIGSEAEWTMLEEKIKDKLEAIMRKVVIIEKQRVVEGISGVPEVYRKLVAELKAKGSLSPIVALAKNFIDRNYHVPELSLRDVANGVQVSPTYLSKLLKRELGLSFIDYLTEVRIRKAIQLMHDPTVKVYEIAEKVGYSSQHYFSNAFKKITGMSPLSYRKGNRR